jgi:hypothetical protein
MHDGSGERPRKPWREIDAARDRSRPERQEAKGEPRSSTRASKQYRAALDALFEKGGVGSIATKLGQTAATAAPSPPASAANPAPAATPAPTTPAPAASAADEARGPMRKRILDAIGREEITRAVDRYVKAYGMPEDFEVLEQALEHTRPARVAEALAALEALLGREKPKRSRTLVGKLRFLEETSDDPQLQEMATRLRARL